MRNKYRKPEQRQVQPVFIQRIPYRNNARLHRKCNKKPEYSKGNNRPFFYAPNSDANNTHQEQKGQRSITVKKTAFKRIQVIQVLSNRQKEQSYIYNQNIELCAEIAPTADWFGFLHKIRNIFKQTGSGRAADAAKKPGNIQNKKEPKRKCHNKPRYFCLPPLPCPVNKQIFHKQNRPRQTGRVLLTQKSQHAAKNG